MKPTVHYTATALLLAASMAATPLAAQETAPAAQGAKCQAFKERHQSWVKEAKEQDVTLKQKVEEMNAATGANKVEAMAVVLNALVKQHQNMRERWMQMHTQTAEMKGGCPMMRGEPGGGMMQQGEGVKMHKQP